ncbi:MAG TPA: hypothetical protein VHS31_17025, partial [Tepidisphaeraceae bacterium]|nr:hypothetical protein [Tepidisphaeraceae bacterium]
VWRTIRSHSILNQWAQENGFQILSSERKLFLRGPFFFRSTKHQTIYYVSVRDAAGNIHRGWVRCGGWFGGLWSDTATVKWDD